MKQADLDDHRMARNRQAAPDKLACSRVHVCDMYVEMLKAQKRLLYALELKLRAVVSHVTWMLGPELSSTGEAGDLNR